MDAETIFSAACYLHSEQQDINIVAIWHYSLPTLDNVYYLFMLCVNLSNYISE